MVHDLIGDLRLTARLIRHAPAFTTASVLTLALGIGATSAIFTAVNAVLLRPVPLPHADRLVMVWETDRDTGTFREPAAWPDFVDFGQRSRSVERLGGFVAGDAVLTIDGGEPMRAAIVDVTDGFLPLLGVAPVAGRPLTTHDDRPGGPAVVWISERLWDRRFGRHPAAIGRSIRVDDRPHAIVGVMPSGADFGLLQILTAADYGRGFADRDARSEVDVWRPLQATDRDFPRDTHPLITVGRLRADASVASAQQELAAIALDLERTHAANKARGVFVEPLQHVIFGRVEAPLMVLLGAAALVLLIACANVANLLLARGTARLREVAVRTALGATTGRLTRQFMVENVVLTVAAAVCGVVLAGALLRVLILIAPPEIPRLAAATIDGRVLTVTVAISIGTGLLFGLVPLWQARRANVSGALRSEEGRGSASRERRLMRSSLVVVEVALAVLLAVSAGLVLKSLWRLQLVRPGFDAAGVLKAEFQLPSSRYPADFKQWPHFREMHRFNAALLERVSALPGVVAAAIAGNHPLDAGFTNSFVVVGREQESQTFPELAIRRVTPGYFRALGVRIVRGRLLALSDATDAPPVMLINEASAARFFPGADPIGQQIAFWGVRRTIVGVLENELFRGLTSAPPLAGYVPLEQAPSATGAEALIVRTSGDPAALTTAVTSAIRAIDPGLAVFGVEPLERTLSESIAGRRFTMLLLGLFATLAVGLAAIGIHGVLSYTVALRSREIGIRLALGARPGQVLRQVLVEGARLALIGAAAGVILALASSRILGSLLYGVGATDPPTFAAVVAILAAVAILSIWAPARRASRVDPARVLNEGP